MAQEELDTSFSETTRSPISDSNQGAAAGRAEEEVEVEVDEDFRGDIERGLLFCASSEALLSGAAKGQRPVASRHEQGGRMGE